MLICCTLYIRQRVPAQKHLRGFKSAATVSDKIDCRLSVRFSIFQCNLFSIRNVLFRQKISYRSSVQLMSFHLFSPSPILLLIIHYFFTLSNKAQNFLVCFTNLFRLRFFVLNGHGLISRFSGLALSVCTLKFLFELIFSFGHVR